MTDVDAAAAEILDMLRVELRQPGDVDIYQVADGWGLTRPGARHRLRKLEAEGKLVSRLVLDPERGRQVRVWRKVNNSRAG